MSMPQPVLTVSNTLVTGTDAETNLFHSVPAILLLVSVADKQFCVNRNTRREQGKGKKKKLFF